MNRGYFREAHKKAANCGNRRCARVLVCALLPAVRVPLDGAGGCETRSRGLPATGTRSVSCDDCFFRQNMLCALALEKPCPTFRPNRPEGLRPPQQMHFVFRQERRRQAAWAFPSAEKQAALHA
jgi:hypothetical protein